MYGGGQVFESSSVNNDLLKDEDPQKLAEF